MDTTDDESSTNVPSTPSRGSAAPNTPPLSPLFDTAANNDDVRTETNDSDDDEADVVHSVAENNPPPPQDAPVFEDQAHIRGTNVHVPTAAAAFNDFLRNFVSLAASRKAQHHNDEDAEDDLSIMSTDSEAEPLYASKLRELLDTDGTASLEIDTMHLYYHNAECQRLYHHLINYPMEIVPLMDILVQREIERLAPNEDTMVPRIQVRPFNLKTVSNLRELDPVSMDTLVSCRGMIVRSSTIIPDLKVAHFQCSVCGTTETSTLDRGRVSEPKDKCSTCSTKAWQIVHNRCVFADKQMVRLQETPDEVPAGQTPASVVTFCFDDLVDSVQPGDKVEITGVLRAQPVRVHPRIRKVKSVYKTYLDVIHFRPITGMENKSEDLQQWTAQRVAELKRLSQDPDIYRKLTESLAPSIWELEDCKKGILCMLFGGNQSRVKSVDDNEANGDDEEEASTKLSKRGDINILLCGDPGTSKSQLLTYVNKLCSRGIYTSGKGSSAVGLTASVVRDPETRDLVLESGALVLSDLGICCIDEFDKMSDTTRSVLHEAMEQQTVSIAKAGIIATLKSRTSVLASANPKESRYNPNMSVVENIQLPPTLLSRFDLIYLILDSPNIDHDRRLAQHLVGLFYEVPNVVEPAMDQKLLRDYIEFARENIHPEIGAEAANQLIASYMEMRNPPGGSFASNGTRTISATARQLESLIRISESLAKMRFSSLVTKEDALEAVRLMKVATQAAATDPRTGRIDMDMITTGRSTIERQMEEQLQSTLKEMFQERRGKQMAVRDIAKQISEIHQNLTVSHDDLVNALRRLHADGAIQFNERAQRVSVRSGLGR